MIHALLPDRRLIYKPHDGVLVTMPGMRDKAFICTVHDLLGKSVCENRLQGGRLLVK